MSKKIGRNDKCHCGSGKKYKYCCINKKKITPSIYQGDSIDKKISVEFEMAILALKKGQIEFGLPILEDLYKLRHKVNLNLRSNIIYSYAVALSVAGYPKKTIDILKNFRETEGEGIPIYDPINTTIEIAAAHISLGQYELALKEIELAHEFSIDKKIPIPIRYPNVYINKGIAERGLNNLDEAYCDFLLALKIACECRDIEKAGISAEHLSRTELLRDKIWEANTWVDKAEIIYKKVAPHHLSNIKKLKLEIIANLDVTKIYANFAEEAKLLDELIKSIEGRPKYDNLNVLDIDLYQFIQGLLKNEQKYWALLPIELGKFKPDNIMRTLISEILSITDHECYPEFVLDTFLVRHFRIQTNSLPIIDEIKCSKFDTFEPNENFSPSLSLYWEGLCPWPWAFRPVLMMLSYLYISAIINMKDQQNKMRKVGISDQQFLALTARTWPRLIHVRYLSLGSFESGSVPTPPYIFEEFLLGRNMDEIYNLDAFQRMGYNKDEAFDMVKGGLIPILISEIGTLLSGTYGSKWGFDVFGGIPIEEFNSMNLPRSGSYIDSMSINERRYGLFVDSYYQTPFWARAPNDYALFGANNELFRDHYDDFRKNLNIVGSIRTKHYSVPIVEVSNLTELRELSNRIPEFPHTSIFFRGQTKNYSLKRTPLVNKLLYGQEDVEEPSLLGAAPRRKLDYEKVHSALQLHVQDFIYQQAVCSDKNLDSVHNEWFELASCPTGDWDIIVMALGQHYGIPTHGIDITGNLEVAVWFATHKFKILEDGKAHYVQMKFEDWPENSELWPVVYFIQPVTNSIIPSIRKIKSLDNLGIEVLRPDRQFAQFFMGAHGIHQNRLAEALVCMVRLKPGLYDTGLTFDYLFPPPDEDQAYKFMINLKKRYSNGPLSQFFSEIVDYKYG